MAQRGGPGAGQADYEDWAADLLVVDLGVLAVGVLDLEALNQGVADGRVLDDLADVVEVRFGVQRFHDAFEALAIIRRAEVLETRCGTSSFF